jgi:hypothetical protein
MNRRAVVLALVALAATVSTHTPVVAAQDSPTAAYDKAILTTWKNLHNKILAMAKDFPEDKFGWKPHPDSRTMEQEFRHVTIGLEMTTAMAKGEKYDYPGRDKADADKPHTRASVVSEMEAALAASFALLDSQGPKPLYIGWLDHQGEHYGKMVDGYRVNGLVPPVSRPKR